VSLTPSQKKKIRNVADVAMWRLCSGCGACAAVCEQRAVRLIDIDEDGIRPVVNTEKCLQCGRCIEVCPGLSLAQEPFAECTIPELRLSWGPVLEVWEGYAADPEIRFKGSSGGVATALSLFCLERMGIECTLHTGTKPENPLFNTPVFSRNRDQLIAQTGSRYAPAAPCAGFDAVDASVSNCVFIGKPCDVAALRKAQAMDSSLAYKVVLSISIFCAGTPSRRGTKAVLDKLNVQPEDVEEFRYRGWGWPGETVVKSHGHVCQMSYEQSWGEILTRYVPLRCRLCPDGSGQFADISCGDPWCKAIEPDDPGQSLVLVRTEKGREMLDKAIKAGYLKLQPIDASAVSRSQKGLLNRKRQLWGRLRTMRATGIVVPDYKGFHLFDNWCNLPMMEKIRSVLSTFKRILCRKLYSPVKYQFGMIVYNEESCVTASPAEKQTEES